jgi:hypothetical protein
MAYHLPLNLDPHTKYELRDLPNSKPKTPNQREKSETGYHATCYTQEKQA